MKKSLLVIVLSAMLIMSGCGASRNNQDNTVILAPDETPAISAPPAAEPPSVEVEPPSAIVNPSVKHNLEGLTRDKYDGLEITAEVLERKAILPGAPVPVTVIVKNTGGKTVDYVQGSGKFETPEAVFIDVEGLQTVMPKDHLGPMTLDFVVKELKPGEELRFVIYVMAIEPNENFDRYTVDMHTDGGVYIAETDWTQLLEEYPDLIPAEPGAYRGDAYFTYQTRDGGESEDSFTVNPDGYAAYEFTINVS